MEIDDLLQPHNESLAGSLAEHIKRTVPRELWRLATEFAWDQAARESEGYPPLDWDEYVREHGAEFAEDDSLDEHSDP